jgi:hypothetical protein
VKLRVLQRQELLLIAEQGLFNLEASAGVLDYFVNGGRLYELEAVAKSVPLANHRINRDRAEGQRKLQLHELTYGDLEP